MHTPRIWGTVFEVNVCRNTCHVNCFLRPKFSRHVLWFMRSRSFVKWDSHSWNPVNTYHFKQIGSCSPFDNSLINKSWIFTSYLRSYKQNDDDNREHKYSLNYTLLIAKYSIYSKCLHDEKLCFDSFLSLLMEKVNIQREIAIKNNKLNQFYETYGNLL